MTSLSSKSVETSSLTPNVGVKATDKAPVRDRIALLDSHGRILALNRGWPREFTDHPDQWFSSAQLGTNFLEMLRAASASCAPLRENLRQIAAMLVGNCEIYSVE